MEKTMLETLVDWMYDSAHMPVVFPGTEAEQFARISARFTEVTGVALIQGSRDEFYSMLNGLSGKEAHALYLALGECCIEESARVAREIEAASPPFILVKRDAS